jgi:hypothetical protein
MLPDGSIAFTWNARGEVVSLNNVSLRYDAIGRRKLDRKLGDDPQGGIASVIDYFPNNINIPLLKSRLSCLPQSTRYKFAH